MTGDVLLEAQEKVQRIISQAGDEPIIVFRAKDELSLAVLTYYLDLCTDADCPPEHLRQIKALIGQFATWQAENDDRVRLPD